MQCGKCNDSQFNNAGFTLIEVLVAVIILAIAAIPILHAFSSTAKASSRALVKARATNVAENIMEDIRVSTLDGAIEKYALTENDPTAEPDKYTVTIDKDSLDTTKIDNSKDKDVYDAINEKGFTAEITIDPKNFEHINAVNISSFDSVSDEYSAIYVMPDNLDKIAENAFVKAAKAAGKDSAQIKRDEIRREIRVDIEKLPGSGTDEDGEPMDLADVYVSVTYLYTGDNGNTILKSDTIQKVLFRNKLFSNKSSDKRLKSVVIMYNPLSFYNFESKKYSYESYGDVITVHNHDSVKTDLYISAQGLGEKYFKKNGLVLEIYENEPTNPGITLYTNMYDRDKFATDKNAVNPVTSMGGYRNLARSSQEPESSDPKSKNYTINESNWNSVISSSKRGKTNNEDDTKLLHAKTLDGKSLNPDDIENKIYDIKIVVYRGAKDALDDSEEDGTKVELNSTFVTK